MRVLLGAMNRATRLCVPLTLLAVLALHVGTAGVPDIYDELPGQYAGPAWEMVRSGDWLVPTLDGIPRLQKPPLVYWLTAAPVRGPGAPAARLWEPQRGPVAGAILGSSFGMVALGKLVMPEPFLALGI